MSIFLGNPSENVKKWIIKYCTPLCFTAVDAGAVIQLKCNGSSLNSQIFQVSTDKVNWTDHIFDSSGMLVNEDTTTEFTLANAGDKVYFKAKADNISIKRNRLNYLQFTTTTAASTKKVKVSGNIMSLLTPEFSQLREVSFYCFNKLFYNDENIYDCSGLNLPATQLADGCYQSMFCGCTSLTVAPVLSATQLADSCYNSMFKGCTSLTVAPVLSATQLANACYTFMFADCTSLTTAPELPATQLADNCYTFMFSGCTSLTATPELPATQLDRNCYQYMFQQCTSLVQASALPATTLASYCYEYMFIDCTKVNNIYIPNLTESKYNAEKASKNSGDLGREGQATFHFKQ